MGFAIRMSEMSEMYASPITVLARSMVGAPGIFSGICMSWEKQLVDMVASGND